MPTSITDVLDRLRRDHTCLGVTLNPPATEAELLVFEQQRGIRLPADIRAFYCCCNGLELDQELFRFVPLAENLADDGWQHLLVSPDDLFIAEYMIYSDAWALSINRLTPADYTIYNAREELTLTTSFAEFLEIIVDHGIHGSGSLYDWEKQLRPPLPNTLPAPSEPAPTQNLPTPTLARRPWYKFW